MFDVKPGPSGGPACFVLSLGRPGVRMFDVGPGSECLMLSVGLSRPECLMSSVGASWGQNVSEVGPGPLEGSACSLVLAPRRVRLFDVGPGPSKGQSV